MAGLHEAPEPHVVVDEAAEPEAASIKEAPFATLVVAEDAVAVAVVVV